MGVSTNVPAAGDRVDASVRWDTLGRCPKSYRLDQSVSRTLWALKIDAIRQRFTTNQNEQR
jgi:hypothetical protein